MEGFSYFIAAVLFGLCFVLLLAKWKAQLDLGLLLTATAVTCLWSGLIAYESLRHENAFHVAPIFDILRYLAWLAFTLQLIVNTKNSVAIKFRQSRFIGWALVISIVLALSTSLSAPFPIASSMTLNGYQVLGLFGYISLAVFGIATVLRLIKSLENDSRKNYQILIAALACLFAADLGLYVFTLITAEIHQWVWATRGIAFSAAALLLIYSVKNPKWSKKICLSHDAVLYFAAFFAGMVFVVITGFALYFIQINIGFWSGIAQFTLLLSAWLMITLFCFSERRRVQLKVVLNKHFFNYKYDYREEWHRFIRTLSPGGPGAHLLNTVIEALAQIVGSKSGALWLRSDAGQFELVAQHGMREVKNANQDKAGSLVQFLEKWQWVINLNEYESEPDLYQELNLPTWLIAIPDAWLVVPLMQDVKLLGFLIISKPSSVRPINWEDHDLLKTAGRQAATHLAQLMTVQALIEAREFQAFSRLSAFVIHDLKNLIAQLSMLVANFPKFKHNASFIEDAISTVQHSVEKMNRLLAQLRKGNVKSEATKPINLGAVVKTVVDERRQYTPKPTLENLIPDITIMADLDRITSVLEHLIQNAQEATEATGKVDVRLSQEASRAIVEVVDTGCGMDANFIRDRLFRPFDTTKGQGGMGIGAYESREHIREMGGDIQVFSSPGQGSTFRISLPIFINSPNRPKK